MGFLSRHVSIPATPERDQVLHMAPEPVRGPFVAFDLPVAADDDADNEVRRVSVDLARVISSDVALCFACAC
eukprot:scaffold2389_cov262-Pinguiococcus_pyrenoidosus.AAC.7